MLEDKDENTTNDPTSSIPVPPPAPAFNAPAGAPAPQVGRGALLGAIRDGQKLKKASSQKEAPQEAASQQKETSDIATALAEQMRRFQKSSDKADSSDDDNDNGDWDVEEDPRLSSPLRSNSPQPNHVETDEEKLARLELEHDKTSKEIIETTEKIAKFVIPELTKNQERQKELQKGSWKDPRNGYFMELDNLKVSNESNSKSLQALEKEIASLKEKLTVRPIEQPTTQGLSSGGSVKSVDLNAEFAARKAAMNDEEDARTEIRPRGMTGVKEGLAKAGKANLAGIFKPRTAPMPAPIQTSVAPLPSIPEAKEDPTPSTGSPSGNPPPPPPPPVFGSTSVPPAAPKGAKEQPEAVAQKPATGDDDEIERLLGDLERRFSTSTTSAAAQPKSASPEPAKPTAPSLPQSIAQPSAARPKSVVAEQKPITHVPQSVNQSSSRSRSNSLPAQVKKSIRDAVGTIRERADSLPTSLNFTKKTGTEFSNNSMRSQKQDELQIRVSALGAFGESVEKYFKKRGEGKNKKVLHKMHHFFRGVDRNEKTKLSGELKTLIEHTKSTPSGTSEEFIKPFVAKLNKDFDLNKASGYRTKQGELSTEILKFLDKVKPGFSESDQNPWHNLKQENANKKK
jgi:hypothetical protein